MKFQLRSSHFKLLLSGMNWIEANFINMVHKGLFAIAEDLSYSASQIFKSWVHVIILEYMTSDCNAEHSIIN